MTFFGCNQALLTALIHRVGFMRLQMLHRSFKTIPFHPQLIEITILADPDTMKQAFENTSTSVAASQMRNALNNLADTVTDPKQKKVYHQ